MDQNLDLKGGSRGQREVLQGHIPPVYSRDLVRQRRTRTNETSGTQGTRETGFGRDKHWETSVDKRHRGPPLVAGPASVPTRRPASSQDTEQDLFGTRHTTRRLRSTTLFRFLSFRQNFFGSTSVGSVYMGRFPRPPDLLRSTSPEGGNGSRLVPRPVPLCPLPFTSPVPGEMDDGRLGPVLCKRTPVRY